MRRSLVALAVAGSILWAMSGVSVIAVAVHERAHHVHQHDHADAIEVALHGHFHEHSGDHDHDLALPTSVATFTSSDDVTVATSEALERIDPGAGPIGVSAEDDLAPRGHDPPRYLLNCVSLT